MRSTHADSKIENYAALNPVRRSFARALLRGVSLYAGIKKKISEVFSGMEEENNEQIIEGVLDCLLKETFFI